MNECHKLLPLIHDWVEGCISFEEALIVQEHLRKCALCNSIILEWLEIGDEIAKLLPINAPQKFGETLSLKFGEISRIPVFELIFGWFLAVCAAVCFKKILASFALLFLHSLSNSFSWIELTLNYIYLIFNFL